MKLTRYFLALLFAVSLLASAVHPAAASTSSETAAKCLQYHTVERGEYLSLIAYQYGVSWPYLADINDLSNPSRIFPGQVLCIIQEAKGGPVTSVPTTTILSVVEDKSVTLQTHNFPANRSFRVLMGKFGTRGVNGIKVGKVDSGKGGQMVLTFNIPDELRDRKQIAIRLETTDGSGYFAYDWFYNYTWGEGSGTGGVDTGKGYTGFPTFSISAVVEDQSVTIKTTNFPPNDTFNVYMGRMGTRGVNGIKVASIDSGEGGSFTATFDIPSELRDRAQIAIRLQSPTSGYYAYNWFWNNTTD
jgi:LysM repeat protein